jgi:GH15 family glucan-1,4-alpha-glucosidase
MLTTWIDTAVKGRLGPVRAGMWSTVVVGTNPIEAEQEVWLEVYADEVELGWLPGHWLENKGVNSLWHVPIPPLPVHVRLKYRAAARKGDDVPSYSPYQEAVVRPNVPEKAETPSGATGAPEGLIGNRMMTVLVDERGGTHDVYYPTVGLHSDVRPASGDQPQSRVHFRAIVGGLATGYRLDWFCERLAWDGFQHYQGATNLLVTELKWRHGPIRVVVTDFAATGPNLPRTAGGAVSPGQYIKRFRIVNEGSRPLERATFAVYVHAEINGGIGETGLSWQDFDGTLLATNRGHGHANRKLARDSTVEFALALDGHGPVQCEPVGPNEAMLLRTLDVPAGGSITVNLLVSGAFTGWRGDNGTFDHWLRPALSWFRGSDPDALEHATAQAWDEYIEPMPTPHFPRPSYAVALRRSALAAALHTDAEWGAVASAFDRGIRAYCWPRDAIWVSGAIDRLGHSDFGAGAFGWLGRVRSKDRPFAYWFQKYTIDGWPEWETPALDQTALIPWGLERFFRRTGDRNFVAACWPIVEQAAEVCMGGSGHPGLRWIDELSLVSSCGLWNQRYGAFLYANACATAGLRAASRLAAVLNKTGTASAWLERADRIWNVGILNESAPGSRPGPGLVDPSTGRFLEARWLSNVRCLWTDCPDRMVDRSTAVDIGALGLAVPFGLLRASDPRLRASADAILNDNAIDGEPSLLSLWGASTGAASGSPLAGPSYRPQASSLATLWMVRYLIQLGRETADGSAWSRALGMLDAILGRLCTLGLGMRTARQAVDVGSAPLRELPGVWELHAMLIESLLDLAGLDYDAQGRTLILDPILAPGWPHIGLSQPFLCGTVSYRLERPLGTTAYRLSLVARLEHPVTLDVGVTCPGLAEPRGWTSRPASPAPRFDPCCSRLAWSFNLPAGETACDWSWN